MNIITADEAKKISNKSVPIKYKEAVKILMDLIEVYSKEYASLNFEIKSCDDDNGISLYWNEIKSEFVSNFMKKLGYKYEISTCSNDYFGDYEVLNVSWE